MKQIVLIGIVLVVIFVGIGVYRLVSDLDGLVARAIEKVGSEATGTSVRVDGVDISLREGSGSVNGLRIGNPEGFEARDIFQLDDVGIVLDVSSVRDDPIVLDEVRIVSPVVHAEFSADGQLNLETLRRQLQTTSPAEEESPSTRGSTMKNLRIARFVFSGARVDIDASALGIEKRSIELPDIRLDDVGGADGVPPDQIARVILTTVAKRTASEVARSEVNRLVEDQLGESLGDKAKGLLEKIGK
jgi:uncharacterized protein involved in outer membrane biogenesis